MIRLKEVDCSDWYACIKLEVTEEQNGISPAPVVYWLEEARLDRRLVPMAIYSDTSLVGFAAYAGEADEQGRHWIMALMIGRGYQRQGYGKAALAELVRLLVTKHGARTIAVGHRTDDTGAGTLFESSGFQEAGGSGDGEIVRSCEAPVTTVGSHA